MPKSTPDRPWSPDEDRIVRETAGLSLSAVVALLPGRTVNAVRSRRSKLGALGKRRRTEADIDAIRAVYASRAGRNLDLAALAARLGRTRQWIVGVAGELGLTNPGATLADEHGRRPPRPRKFATDEERRAALAVSRREWYRTHEHPRGALGLRHSDEAKRTISEKSRAFHARLTDADREAIRVKRNATNLERYGTANPAGLAVTHPYSRANRGRRADIGDQYFMSRWEANYCRFLMWLKERGEIADWAYEPDRFVFHGETTAPITYTPDFRVIENDGRVVYHEVKGWMTPKDRTKLKRMKKHYPAVELVVIGGDEMKALLKWKRLIPNWEEDE